MSHFSRLVDVLPKIGGAVLADNNQAPEVKRKTKPTVCPHSAAFLVQSVEGKTETFLTGGGVRSASTPGDKASAAMLTQG